MAASAVVLVVAAATILAALAFEHLGGYAPCPLCLEERYAYYFAVPASGDCAHRSREDMRLAPRASCFFSSRSPSSPIWRPASTTPASSGNGGRARANAPAPSSLQWGEGGIVDTPIIRCDEASWRFFGLSFAGWNAVVSAFLAAVAAWGAAQKR